MTTLSDDQLNELENQLRDERKRLRGEIREELLRNDSEAYGELAGQVHDHGDEAMADMLADMNIAIVGKAIQELREVEAALERIAEGGFGRCEDCDQPITFERLKAYPTARRCVADQERYDQSHASGGTPSI